MSEIEDDKEMQAHFKKVDPYVTEATKAVFHILEKVPTSEEHICFLYLLAKRVLMALIGNLIPGVVVGVAERQLLQELLDSAINDALIVKADVIDLANKFGVEES